MGKHPRRAAKDECGIAILKCGCHSNVNNDHHLEKPYLSNISYGNLYKHTVVFDNDVGKGFDMTQKFDIHKTSLMLILDGMACSEATAEVKQAGAYLAGLVVADSKGKISADKLKAITSIMEMAAEADSPVFEC